MHNSLLIFIKSHDRINSAIQYCPFGMTFSVHDLYILILDYFFRSRLFSEFGISYFNKSTGDDFFFLVYEQINRLVITITSSAGLAKSTIVHCAGKL